MPPSLLPAPKEWVNATLLPVAADPADVGHAALASRRLAARVRGLLWRIYSQDSELIGCELLHDLGFPRICSRMQQVLLSAASVSAPQGYQLSAARAAHALRSILLMHPHSTLQSHGQGGAARRQRTAKDAGRRGQPEEPETGVRQDSGWRCLWPACSRSQAKACQSSASRDSWRCHVLAATAALQNPPARPGVTSTATGCRSPRPAAVLPPLLAAPGHGAGGGPAGGR